MADDDTEGVREEVGGIVDQEEVEGDQGDGDHVTEDNPAVQIAQLGELDVDDGGDQEEQGAQDGGDSVHPPQRVSVRVKTRLPDPRDFLTCQRHPGGL